MTMAAHSGDLLVEADKSRERKALHSLFSLGSHVCLTVGLNGGISPWPLMLTKSPCLIGGGGRMTF